MCNINITHERFLFEMLHHSAYHESAFGITATTVDAQQASARSVQTDDNQSEQVNRKKNEALVTRITVAPLS